MRLLGLKESDRIYLDADPEWADSFLGPEPELAPADGDVWGLYWTTRNSQPTDSLAGLVPLDLVRALELNEHLYGIADARRLSEKLLAMDRTFLADKAERAKQRAKRKDKGKR
ncbi:MAG TPA: hypothetical protein VGB13_00700 [Candidatus Krumholzibacteria bacterium]